MHDIIVPTWAAPSNVKAFSTTRLGGMSLPPFDSNNLGLHVGDNPSHVQFNRGQLIETHNIPSEPHWLNQTHSHRSLLITENTDYPHPHPNTDAALTRTARQVLAVMTADCLPILITNQQGTEVAAIHAGWRGLLSGVIQNTLKQLTSSPDSLMAWIGPSMCGRCYEVGDEVRQAFVLQDKDFEKGFTPNQDKFMADLPLMAQSILNRHDIHQVFLSDICTYEQDDLFFSYRKTPKTGRIATLIWFEPSQEA